MFFDVQAFLCNQKGSPTTTFCAGKKQSNSKYRVYMVFCIVAMETTLAIGSTRIEKLESVVTSSRKNWR